MNLDELIKELLKEDERLSKIEIPEKEEEKKILYRALRNIRKPGPISKEYLEAQDKFLKEENKQKGIVLEKSIKKIDGIISVWQGDITRLKVDAIVNACNPYLLGCFTPNHNCIDNVIHSYAGMELREECNRIMQGETLPNGEAVLTSAYNLPSKFIIQTVGPNLTHKLNAKDCLELRNCYKNSLNLCLENNIKTIAFPCISTGLYHFPKEKACEIAIETVKEFIKENEKRLEHIIFNVYQEEDKILYENYLKGERK